METHSLEVKEPLGESNDDLTQAEKLIKAKKLLLIIAIGSIVMFFAGLTSMHFVSKGSAKFWLSITFPSAFMWSTVLIILSSLTMMFSVRAVRNNQQGMLKGLLLLSLILGLGFVYSQFQGWSEMADKGMHLRGDFLQNLKGEYGTDYVIMTGADQSLQVEYRDGHYFDPNDPTGNTMIDEEISEYRNPAARNLITMTGLHALHVGGGILWLAYLVVMAFVGRLTPERSLSVSQGAVYWHFVDLLWVFLLLFLYFIH